MHRRIFSIPLTNQPAVCIHCKLRPQKSSFRTSFGELKTQVSGSPSSRCHTQRLPSESLHVATLVHSHGHRPARSNSPGRAPITLLLGLRKPASVLSSLLVPVTSRLTQTGHHCLAVHAGHVVGHDAPAWPELPPVTTLPLSRHFY